MTILNTWKIVKKKNKKHGESQIKANAARHFKAADNGQVYLDTDTLFEDHGIDPAESRQNSYNNQITQNIKDIEKSSKQRVGNSWQFQEERFSYKHKSVVIDLDNSYDVEEVFVVKHDLNNVEQLRKRKSQNQKRFKKDVVIDLDNGSDIEEISVVKNSKHVNKENTAAVTIVDDDIVVLSDNVGTTDDKIKNLENRLRKSEAKQQMIMENLIRTRRLFSTSDEVKQ